MSYKTYLNRWDWEKLDDILHQIGYGGYYDFLECLRQIHRNLAPEINVDDVKDVRVLIGSIGYYALVVAKERNKN